MSLSDALAAEQVLAQALGAELVTKEKGIAGILVTDFPMCKKIINGEPQYNYSSGVAIAIEQLQERLKLHGEYSIEELLEFELETK